MYRAIGVTPFAPLPHSDWNEKKEKKARIPIDELLYSSSDSSDEENQNNDGEFSNEYESSSFLSESNASYESRDMFSDSQRTTNAEATEVLKKMIEEFYSSAGNDDDTKDATFLGNLLEPFKSALRNNRLYQEFQFWRATKAEERRHHLLKYYEKKVLDFERERKEKIEHDIDSNRRELLKKIKARKKRMKNFKKKKNIMDQVSEKFRRILQQREDDSHKLQFLCANMPRWANEREQRKLKEQEYNREQLQSQEEEMRLRSSRRQHKTVREEELKCLRQDQYDSQHVVGIMRMAGTLPGVNAPNPIPMSTHHSTSRHIEISLREDMDFKSINKPHRQKDRVTPFTLDLLEFRNVVQLRAIGIGEKGALFLGADFTRGACARLEVLDLRHCGIKSRGLARVLQGVRTGNLYSINTLVLKGNCLTPTSVDTLIHSLRSGSLQELRELDLDQNELGDEGVSVLAHAMLGRLFKCLTRLSLNSNLVGDKGFGAMARICIAAAPSRCPDLGYVSLQGNKISAEAKRSFHPLPGYIAV